MSDSQQRTLQIYSRLLQMGAASHVLRSAYQVGLLATLRGGQHTAEQLAAACQTQLHATQLLLDCLVAMELVERYGDDYALAPVAQLLGRYDYDAIEQAWNDLPAALRGTDRKRLSADELREYLAQTQWVHTAAAMQVASVLEINADQAAMELLDLGCGAGVWSAVMAYRSPAMQVTAIDTSAALRVAQETADSIQLGDRWQAVVADPLTVELDPQRYDAVVVGGWLHTLEDERLTNLLKKLFASLRDGGVLVAPDLYRGEEGGDLMVALEAMRIELLSPGGTVRSPVRMQEILNQIGFEDCRYTPLPVSRYGFGLLVARAYAPTP